MMLDLLRPWRKRGGVVKATMPETLSGKYDIRGDRLVGIVGKVPAVENGAMWIQAWRGRNLIAEELIPDPGAGFLDFVMPIAGRFTLDELAREAVIIKARNDRGDSGPLKLNGVTQLELIRRYLGIPVETIFDLDFCRAGNARPFLGKGWSPSEELFTWTMGPDSFVQFASPATPATHILRLRYSVFLTEFITTQPLNVFINDEFVDTINEDQRFITFRQLRVRWDVFDGRPVSELRLNHPRCARPDEQLGRTDTRPISYCFYNISLVRPLKTGD